ncbi:unnamed protein product [Ceratitis capitata]|uniref:(Mediterranean fruit fly) hypothetical protein n=1 Tax=Ceratitis capitata TaxID=7213 RepID=A0A811UGA8_CERCA|nr:unnamed protein product [Ceratitis capitata]
MGAFQNRRANSQDPVQSLRISRLRSEECAELAIAEGWREGQFASQPSTRVACALAFSSHCGGNGQVIYTCLQWYPQTICHQTAEQLVMPNENFTFNSLTPNLLQRMMSVVGKKDVGNCVWRLSREKVKSRSCGDLVD